MNTHINGNSPAAVKSDVNGAKLDFKKIDAAKAGQDHGSAELVLGLYHSVARAAAGAFVLAYITPAKIKEAGKRPLNVQRFRIGDARDGGRSQGPRQPRECLFRPSAHAQRSGARRAGEGGRYRGRLALVLEEDRDTGKSVILPRDIVPTFEIERATIRRKTGISIGFLTGHCPRRRQRSLPCWRTASAAATPAVRTSPWWRIPKRSIIRIGRRSSGPAGRASARPPDGRNGGARQRRSLARRT